jgi:hypothetical protein
MTSPTASLCACGCYAINVVVNNEAYASPFAAYLGAAHVLLDAAHHQVPVSSTQLRTALNNKLMDNKLNLLRLFVAAQYGAVPPLLCLAWCC